MTGDAKSLFFLVFVDIGLQNLEWYLLGMYSRMYSHPLLPFTLFPFTELSLSAHFQIKLELIMLLFLSVFSLSLLAAFELM